MEWLDQIWQTVLEYINVPYLLTFMLLAYLVKRYFQGFILNKWKQEIKSVFIVLVIATVVAVPYLVFGVEWQKVLFSYALGTSLHELILNWFEDLFQRKG